MVANAYDSSNQEGEAGNSEVGGLDVLHRLLQKDSKNNSNKNDDILPSRSITPLPSTIVSQV